MERWPRVGRNVSAVHPKPSYEGRGQNGPQGRCRQPQMPRSSTSPEITVEAAKKDFGVEAALAALAAVGTTDGTEL